MSYTKKNVKDFWNENSCGEDLYLSNKKKDGYSEHSNKRYNLEGYLIFPFAEFEKSNGLKVLEIGVGLGADHQKFAESGALLNGIDLTERAIRHTSNRFKAFSLNSNLKVGDAENLDFESNLFDVVYSWGVLHHSPNTPKAISEVYRVLKPNGEAKIMIYHKWSLVGFMLWIRYALLNFKPWLTLNEIYSEYLESPGTKAYSISQAKKMFSNFKDIKITTLLSPHDLLESDAGQRHRGFILKMAYKIWPRFFLRYFFKNFGLTMLITAKK